MKIKKVSKSLPFFYGISYRFFSSIDKRGEVSHYTIKSANYGVPPRIIAADWQFVLRSDPILTKK